MSGGGCRLDTGVGILPAWRVTSGAGKHFNVKGISITADTESG